MGLLGIKHFLDYGPWQKDWPTFMLEMSDGNEYLSHMMAFQLKDLETQRTHFTKEFIDSLIASPAVEISDLVDGRYMFAGAGHLLTEAPRELPALKYGFRMFYGCVNLKNRPNMPSLIESPYTFEDC